MSKQKLELMWVGKEKRAKLEPRILIEDPEKSYHADKRVSDNDIFDNMLIHGDNLLALKALEQDYAGRVKCIYIDPPYNTGNAFEHYDDGLEHSIWLSLMRERLELLKNLLSDDGVLWMQLDDNEMHYGKVLCDEIFGRQNFISTITWHKKRGKDNSSRYFSITSDYILVYAKNAGSFYVNRIELDDSTREAYTNPDNDPRGDYRLLGLWARKQGGSLFAYTMEDGKTFSERLWLVNLDTMKRLESENRIVVKGDKLYRKLFLYENRGSIPETIWINLSNNANAKDELKKLFPQDGDNLFDTPKPEPLIERILEISSKKGDLVLDSFLGSGTTAAVAHKMGRRWIGIELGEHCDTHCVPRLKKVIDGEDAGGITKSANWRGGGGFRYYNLAPSLVKFDEWGNPIINKEFNENMLVRALCKVEGFNFDPSPDVYWKQGKSTESDFIYVTTQHLTAQMLQKLSDDVGDSCTLLICCGSFDGKKDSYGNLTIKKIPKAILKKCEWNHDDYSLEIKNLPMSAPDPQPSPAPRKKSFKKQQDDNQLDLF